MPQAPHVQNKNNDCTATQACLTMRCVNTHATPSFPTELSTEEARRECQSLFWLLLSKLLIICQPGERDPSKWEVLRGGREGGNGWGEGARDTQGPEPGQGCVEASTRWAEATSSSPRRKRLRCSCSDATSCLNSFSFRGLFNISNKNKINNGSVYGNLRQKWRWLRRELSGSRPEGGLEDPLFLGVSSFVLQFVSPSYHTRVFLP